MQKSRLGAIQNHTEVCNWLMSGTEEDMAGLHLLCLLKRPRTSCYLSAQKPSDDTALKSFCFTLVQPVIFSGKSKLSAKDVGSGHPELAQLACDLYCPKGLTLEGTPTLLSLF